MILVKFLDFYSLVVLAAVIISWVQLPPNHITINVLGRLTEPLLAPIRRILPEMGGLDLSPVILLFGLRIVRGVLLSAALGGI